MIVIHAADQEPLTGRELHHGALIDSYENPERVERIVEALRSRPDHRFVEPDALDDGLLRRVHTDDYVDFLVGAWSRWVERGEAAPAAMGFAWPGRGGSGPPPSDLIGQLGYYSFAADCSIVEGTEATARTAAAVAMTAADHTAETGDAVFGLCRPPGHHASVDQFGGYCFYNNAAVAAQRLRDRGMRRVGVLDVDYHHGNGTQSIFDHRADVMFASVHADPVEEFPWFVGHADETGHGAGVGANLNLPLPRGASTAEWFDALGRAVSWIDGVDALVVSLGVDTHVDDPLGTFQLSTADFGTAGSLVRALGVPTTIVMEGGYAADAIGDNVAAFIEPF